MLTNAHYVVDDPNKMSFKLKTKADSFKNQFDPDIKDIKCDEFQNFPVIQEFQNLRIMTYNIWFDNTNSEVR